MKIRKPFNRSLLLLPALMLTMMTTALIGCGDDGAESVEENVDLSGTDLAEEPAPVETSDASPSEEAPEPVTTGEVPAPGSSVSDGETLYISWIMDEPVENPSTGVPVSRLQLSINGNAFVVMQKTNGKHQEVPKGEYSTYKSPPGALGAVKSWWAGAGDVIYAIRAGNTMRVMRAEIDEESGQGEFKEIAAQPIS